MTRREKRYLKQLVEGLILIMLGVISAVVLDGDITACVMICMIAVPYVIHNIHSLYYYGIVKKRRRMGEF